MAVIIPHDIIADILLSLPVKSLVRFKCVCKAWKHHIESSDFIQDLLHRSLKWESDYCSLILTCGSSLYLVDNVDKPSPSPRELPLPRSFHHNNCTVKVVGSCNGLLCITSGIGCNHYFLCNPSYPDSFKILPFADNGCTGWWQRLYIAQGVKFGFGYDHQGDDYKIVYAWCPCLDTLYVNVLLYSSKAGSWKFIENPGFTRKAQTYGVVLNNCLHWCVSEDKVLRFDLHDEQWYEVDLPDCARVQSYYVIVISVFGGCLSATLEMSSHSKCFKGPEFWVMREYNVKESWTRLFSLPSMTSRVLHYSKKRNQVLLMDDATHDLGWYSPQEKKIVERIEIQGDLKISGVKSLVGSLVPVITKRSGQQHGDEGNIQERKDDETEIEAGESSSISKKGRRGRKKRSSSISIVFLK